jgi:hypothetical protein
MTKHKHGGAPRRPGDYILDRYLKNASPEALEEAREQLRKYARLLTRIGKRIAEERKPTPPSPKDVE